MASWGSVQDLCKEATCPICLEYFVDPVTIVQCGHNFCQVCLTQSLGEQEGDALVVSCPQCRKTTQRNRLIPNRKLKNLVEIVKQLQLWYQKTVRGAEGVCQKHQEPLKLFCRDHQTPICVVCDNSQEHQSHKVLPWEEAFEEYKDQSWRRIKILREERDKILTYKADAEKESQDLLNQTDKERQKTKAGFQQMHQFLEEQEKSPLDQIEVVEEEIARRRDEHLAGLRRELSSLENVIQEIEEKCQQPASEFLQDIGRILQRSEKAPFENPMAFPPELLCKIREFCDVKPLVERVMDQFPAKVTLDPDTAHPRLILSEDHKSVRWGENPQDLPNNPERFDFWTCVLGREEFTAGRHSWEVTVENEGLWNVGVARKSVRRKGGFCLGSEEGIWAVGKLLDLYIIFNAPDSPPLSLKHELKRIRVTLNYAEEQVSFSNADTGFHIYTFSGAPFCGETLLPFFHVDSEAHLRLSH